LAIVAPVVTVVHDDESRGLDGLSQGLGTGDSITKGGFRPRFQSTYSMLCEKAFDGVAGGSASPWAVARSPGVSAQTHWSSLVSHILYLPYRSSQIQPDVVDMMDVKLGHKRRSEFH
jgi:hypothetical protein